MFQVLSFTHLKVMLSCHAMNTERKHIYDNLCCYILTLKHLYVLCKAFFPVYVYGERLNFAGRDTKAVEIPAFSWKQ